MRIPRVVKFATKAKRRAKMFWAQAIRPRGKDRKEKVPSVGRRRSECAGDGQRRRLVVGPSRDAVDGPVCRTSSWSIRAIYPVDPNKVQSIGLLDVVRALDQPGSCAHFAEIGQARHGSPGVHERVLYKRHQSAGCPGSEMGLPLRHLALPQGCMDRIRWGYLALVWCSTAVRACF